ncbi:MAG: DUF2470 domain-containing protein [Thermoanaerobaculia bacterium]|nr:DUF2470 domain-containing protein [Thermoanaerobaculia bacterium]
MDLERHRDARALLYDRKAGILSTLSKELGGYPFGSVVPYCLDRRGRPVVLISDIAEHTHNVLADPRASLLIRAEGHDVQVAARLTVVARAEKLEDGIDEAAERYYRYFPASRGYHEVHDFSFFVLEPVRFRWIGGFGDIRWIEPPELLVTNPFDRAQEEAIVSHMNEDHADSMRGYCRALAGLEVGEDETVRMTGIDAEGCDLRAGDRHVRLRFSEPATTPGRARERLVEMARQAREHAAASG